MVMMSTTVPLLTSDLSTEDLYLQLLSISMKTGCKVRKTLFRKLHTNFSQSTAASSPHLLNVKYIFHVCSSLLNTKNMQMWLQSFQLQWCIKKTKAAYLCTIPHLCRKLTAKTISAE